MSILSSGQYYGKTDSRRKSPGFAVCCLVHTHGRRLPIHTHRTAYFSMTLHGGYREETGRRSIDYGPFTIVYHPPGTSHLDEIAPGGARFLMVEAEDALVSGEGVSDSLRSGYPVELPGSASWIALRLLLDDSDIATESTVLELLAAVPDEKRGIERAPAWLRGALDRVRDEFRSPPTTRQLAASVGVHPVHLARVVRRETGTTVAGLVMQRRVEYAAGLLTSETPLSSIALQCGFADQAHFTRTFRSVTGSTPGAIRRLLRA